MSRVYSSGDYAGLTAGQFTFYYGYEQEKDGEWAFTAHVGKEEKMRLSASELGFKKDTVECLLAGIGKYLETLSPQKP